MGEEELPEACKICMKLNGKTELSVLDCSEGVLEGGSACLPKDRAMIVLLYKLLKAWE